MCWALPGRFLLRGRCRDLHFEDVALIEPLDGRGGQSAVPDADITDLAGEEVTWNTGPFGPANRQRSAGDGGPWHGHRCLRLQLPIDVQADLSGSALLGVDPDQVSPFVCGL